jgi:hypothetical protein
MAFRLYSASTSLSLATNVVATGCTAYGLWCVPSVTYERLVPEIYTYRCHRKLVVDHLGQGTRVQKVLSLLVDTGVIYCALQVLSYISFPCT